MNKKLTRKTAVKREVRMAGYKGFLTEIGDLLESARRTVARTTNSIITASYWEIGRRIVKFEQRGNARARYGEQLIENLSKDLTSRFGRGFGVVNLSQMRKFYNYWPSNKIFQTSSEKLHSGSRVRSFIVTVQMQNRIASLFLGF